MGAEQPVTECELCINALFVIFLFLYVYTKSVIFAEILRKRTLFPAEYYADYHVEYGRTVGVIRELLIKRFFTPSSRANSTRCQTMIIINKIEKI